MTKAAYITANLLIVAALMYGSVYALHAYAVVKADIADLKAEVEQLQKTASPSP